MLEDFGVVWGLSVRAVREVDGQSIGLLFSADEVTQRVIENGDLMGFSGIYPLVICDSY